MASKGIKDRVAIIGMGCTKFGEHWDKGPEDLLVDAAYQAYESAGIAARRRRRVLARHDGLGSLGPDAQRAAQDSVQAGHPRREHVRDGFRGAAAGLLCGRVGRVRHGDGDRRREAQGLGLLGPRHQRAAERRHRGQHDGARVVLAARARVLQEVRTRPRQGQGRAHAHRVEESQERREESQGAVPEGSVARDDQELAQDCRPARHHGLLGRVGRLGGGDRRPRRGRAQVLQESDLHQGAVVRRGAGRRAAVAGVRFHDVSAKSSPPRRTPTRRRASPIRASRSAWPRFTIASRRPSWCCTRISASARAAPHGRT